MKNSTKLDRVPTLEFELDIAEMIERHLGAYEEGDTVTWTFVSLKGGKIKRDKVQLLKSVFPAFVTKLKELKEVGYEYYFEAGDEDLF